MAPTATTQEQATFRSKDDNLRLVVESASEQMDAKGVRVPRPGKVIEFRNGTFNTSDEEQLEFLRNHRLFNLDFFEVGNEPDRPKPEQDDVIAAILDAAIEDDADKLRSIARLEYASHSRPAVINAVKSALRRMGEDPEEGTKPPSSPVPADQLEAIAEEFQRRLDESGTLTHNDDDGSESTDPPSEPARFEGTSVGDRSPSQEAAEPGTSGPDATSTGNDAVTGPGLGEPPEGEQS